MGPYYRLPNLGQLKISISDVLRKYFVLMFLLFPEVSVNSLGESSILTLHNISRVY